METVEKRCSTSTDELCQCGHLKSQHNSFTHRDGSNMYFIPQVGHCSCCNCTRFRWTKFIKTFLGKVRFPSLN
jgi:hypothetical protein